MTFPRMLFTIQRQLAARLIRDHEVINIDSDYQYECSSANEYSATARLGYHQKYMENQKNIRGT